MLLLFFGHSVVSNSLRPPWTVACQASLFFTNSQTLLKIMFTQSVMSSNHLILCHPLLLLPSVFPSIRAFSHESALRIRWTEYWSFSFSISPSNEYSGLISLRIDWFDPLEVQGTLKSQLAAVAAAKLLQSCPTLCDPIDGSPPGSPIPGILRARTLEWVAIAFPGLGLVSYF